MPVSPSQIPDSPTRVAVQAMRLNRTGSNAMAILHWVRDGGSGAFRTLRGDLVIESPKRERGQRLKHARQYAHFGDWILNLEPGRFHVCRGAGLAPSSGDTETPEYG